jgi:PadR family transcriptional regulator, regulatory protein PadR
MRDPIAREFLLAFWKIHILHHAADGRGVYGHWMLEELSHHGYRLSPGTLYPILARMAKRGWLRAAEPARSKGARIYRLTPRGHEVLNQLRASLDELYGEVGDRPASRQHPSSRTGRSQAKRRPSRLPSSADAD